MAHAVDEAGGDVAVGDVLGLLQGGVDVVRVDQLPELHTGQLLAGEAEGLFPGRVEGDGRHVETQHRQQLAGEFPGAVALAGAALHALAQHLVEALQGLGGVLLLADVLQHADEAHAAAVFEKGPATGLHPPLAAAGQLQAVLDLVFVAAVLGQRLVHLALEVGAVLRVAAVEEGTQVDLGVLGQLVERLAALIPDDPVALGLVVPHAHARRVDGQACAHLHFHQRFFGHPPATTLMHLGERAGHRLGQQAEVLLEHVVDGALAHHLHRVLLAEHAGEEDERGLGCEASRHFQGLGPGGAGQDEVAEDQVVLPAQQGFFHGPVVIDQGGLHRQAATFERQQGQLGITGAVFD